MSSVGKVNFSSDGKTLATYSDDGTAPMWNVTTGQEMLSGLPLNDLLADNVLLDLLLGDGNGILEVPGADRFRILRLPTLSQIDAAEKVPVPKP